MVLLWFLLSVRKIARIRPQLRQAREGLAAELAVAQYLTAAAENGYPVLHDLPADGFNIDHVVIGHSAVFAIETKSRKKPEAKSKASARVVYDGRCLKFPEHIETKPLDQARAQAPWLADYLKGELGHPVKVVPVLALPGWYVGYTKEAVKSDVLVQNPKVPVFVGWERFGEALGERVKARVRFGLRKRYGLGTAERSL